MGKLDDLERRRTERFIDPDSDDRTPQPPAATHETAAPEPEYVPDVPAVTALPVGEWGSCLDDPDVVPGGSRNRTNYLPDEAWARYTAAVYWLARNPSATDVPESVSGGIAEFLEKEAKKWERRYNSGRPFPATPNQVRKAKKPARGRR